MKKLYLLAAAAILGANFASAQSLEKVWQKYYTDYAFDSWPTERPTPNVNWADPTNIINGNGSRTAVGLNGKLYTLNCRTMSIMELSEAGYKDVYVLPSLKGRTIQFNTVDADFGSVTKDDYYGVLITRDDAGHFIVGHGFLTGAMPKTWTIYDPASKKAKHFDVKFKDEKNSMLRVDAIGRAFGNVLQDGGLYVAPTSIYWSGIKDFTWGKAENVQLIKMINFYSEEENNTDVEKVNADGYLTSNVSLDGHLDNICQPLYTSTEEFQAAVQADGLQGALEKGFMLYSNKAGAPFAKDAYGCLMGTFNGSTNVANPFEDFAATDMGQNWSGKAGFDTFILQGERYYVASYATEDAYKASSANNSFAIFNSKGMKVAEQIIDWKTVNGYTTISYEPVDDTTVNIYLFGEAAGTTIPEVAAAGNYGVAGQYKFSVPKKSSGIEDIAVDEAETAPVYYNLQGVEVANPENGIYIVRRGNKVTKEVIR